MSAADLATSVRGAEGETGQAPVLTARGERDQAVSVAAPCRRRQSSEEAGVPVGVTGSCFRGSGGPVGGRGVSAEAEAGMTGASPRVSGVRPVRWDERCRGPRVTMGFEGRSSGGGEEGRGLGGGAWGWWDERWEGWRLSPTPRADEVTTRGRCGDSVLRGLQNTARRLLSRRQRGG